MIVVISLVDVERICGKAGGNFRKSCSPNQLAGVSRADMTDNAGDATVAAEKSCVTIGRCFVTIRR